MINLRAKAAPFHFISPGVSGALVTVQQRRYYSTKGFKKINNDMHRSAAKYENVDIEKLNILKENIKKSGIYMLTNLINGKRYIGSSENLSRRFSEYLNTNYLIRANYMNICSALLLHGYSNFSLEILEFYKVSDLLIREKHSLDLLNPEYNIAKDTTAPMSGRIHSDEARKKISDAHQGLHAGENNHMFGKTHSDETRKKISDAMSGENNHMFGKNHSDETRKKMSEPRSTSQRLEVFDIKSNQITTYDSVNKAAIALNINGQAISNYFIRNQQKPYKGQYIFKKI
jgi:group I intron endonuclease